VHLKDLQEAASIYEPNAVFADYERCGLLRLCLAVLTESIKGIIGRLQMNWDQIEGKWKQYAGKAKTKWGKLTDNDLQTLSGKKEQLVGLVQERYGIAKDEAERQVNDWGNSFSDDNAAQRDENARRDKSRGAGSV
jgi:uncharacterized protein YjbJ (UPF0337 family)